MTMKPITKVIPQGQRTAQLAAGKTVSLSSNTREPLEITIKSFKPIRSKSQNKLAWMWASTLSTDSGNTDKFHYSEFKLNHLAPIMARDDSDFGLIFDEFKGLMFGKEGTPLYSQLIDGLVSASKSTTKQMAEALTNWEMTEGANGNALPRPDDYMFALQLKSYEQTPEANR